MPKSSLIRLGALKGNQLYIKHHSDDEDFEPVEAYFFDPTEYLEEELRQQLNDKITLSVLWPMA